MQLGWVELWWLDALPLDQLLLLVEVLAYHPLDLLKRHVQQFGNDSYRDDGLCF